MKKVNLRAKEKHEYDRRALMPGDEYEASEQDARLLTLLGRSEYAESTYQTRDMTAEQPAILIKRRGRPRKH